MKDPQVLPAISYSNKFFSLEVDLRQPQFWATMQLYSDPISTKYIGETNKILERKLPTVFLNQCYNDGKLSFYEEAKNTEIGHLFEHILLEELFLVKKKLNKKFKAIQGKTSWNWVKDPVGRFYIQINPIELEEAQIRACLENSINLTSQILARAKKEPLIN